MASTSSENRTRIDIIASILDACHYGTKKTRVMYQCNLSFRQLTDYLDLLSKANLLIIENDRRFTLLRVSSKGKDLLKAYNSMKTIMNSS